jgi:hypothetical protein
MGVSPVDVREESNDIERPFLAIINGMQQVIDNNYLEITIRVNLKTKFVKLYKNKAIIVGCNSLREGSEIINEINNENPKIKLGICEIHEIMVVYNHNFSIDNLCQCFQWASPM